MIPATNSKATTNPPKSNDELSLEDLKDASGGYRGGGGGSGGGRKTSFSQGQTSFTELGSIERKAGVKGKAPSKAASAYGDSNKQGQDRFNQILNFTNNAKASIVVVN